MGKTSEAAVYRKYINSMKKKTKKMNEGMHNHPEFALITVAVDELEKGLMELGEITYKSVDELMQGISKRNNISPTLLHNQFKAKHLTIPDNWAIRKRMNKMKGIEEATMTAAQKRKDTRLKKKYDDSDMKKNMQKQYGKEEGKKVYFATIRKQAMKKEEYISELSDDTMDSYLDKAAAQVEKRSKGMNRAAGLIVKRLVKSKPPTKLPERPPIATVKNGDVIDARDRFGKKPPTNEETDKYNVSEEGLRSWFGKSSGTTKSGRCLLYTSDAADE